MRHRTTILSLSAMLACASPVAPDAIGRWGSPQAALTLSRTGGTLALQCGSGLIDSAWTLSENGDFSATGVTFGGGGPDPIGGRPAMPSRFTGRITGNTFVLTGVVSASNATIGPYRLRRDGPAVSQVCL